MREERKRGALSTKIAWRLFIRLFFLCFVELENATATGEVVTEQDDEEVPGEPNHPVDAEPFGVDDMDESYWPMTLATIQGTRTSTWLTTCPESTKVTIGWQDDQLFF